MSYLLVLIIFFCFFFKNVIKVIDCFCICSVSISHQKSDAWDVNLGAQMLIAHGAVHVICLFS
jgi:hypothetical protein